MLLPLLALALVAVALTLPTAIRAVRRLAERRAAIRAARPRERLDVGDPGRERRAEQRARELLRSCVNDEEWGMYRDLGFIRVKGRLAGGERPGAQDGGDPPYAYLVYPHKPIVAYVPKTRRLLSEYCVEFPDLTGALGQSRLPDSDDVLAKWMALTGDERRLINKANLHLPGRQIDPGRVRRDLWRLAEWEGQRRSSSAPSAGRR